ncbi:MAG: MiaB/RimO family radical SAM methylthiotransferase, partial [Planctomycetota bacterium]
ITVRDKKYSAYVTVMYGCDFSCTYCIVPYTRGVEQSRRIAELKDEVERLCADGVKEITFLGQTVDSYGKRLPGRPNLGDLMEAVHDTAGLERIRFITSHPQLMRDPILRRMGELPKVCEYLHIPAQSGSNRQLKAMNRGYTVERYREICDRARELVPDLSIASDFIVGFPGETDEDFEQTLRLVEEQEFGQAYIFKYSPRPHTPAWDMEDDVPEVLKKERNQRLLRAQEAVQLRLNRSRIGRTERVLCEGTSRGRSENLAGRNRQNRIVCFQGDAEKLVGQIVEVEITDASSFALYGCLPGQAPLFAQPKVEEAVYVPPTAGALVGAPPQGAPSKKLRPLPMLSEPSESDCH